MYTETHKEVSQAEVKVGARGQVRSTICQKGSRMPAHPRAKRGEDPAPGQAFRLSAA